MKFTQVPLGQRFLFQGEPFVKIGPLTARRERDGETRLIPRSALITLPQLQGAEPAAEAGVLPDPVSRALAAYESQLRSILLPAGGEADPVLQARLDEGLTAARRAFQETLSGTAEPRRRT